jgi:ABC-type transporter Mla subunit MlaD
MTRSQVASHSKEDRVLARTKRTLHVATILLTVSVLVACSRGKTDAPSQGNKAELQAPAALKRSAEAAKLSLEGLKPSLTALNGKLAELHRQYDPLSPALPDFAETRAKFYATDEGLGRMNAKLPWLSGRIDAAVQAGNGAELAQIAKEVTETNDQIRRVEQIVRELQAEVVPFKKLADEKAAELQASGRISCE